MGPNGATQTPTRVDVQPTWAIAFPSAKEEHELFGACRFNEGGLT